jgi:hypothetical protein
MFPKAWCDFALSAAVLVELFFKKILRKNARLRETVYALLYFAIDYNVIVS